MSMQLEGLFFLSHIERAWSGGWGYAPTVVEKYSSAQRFVFFHGRCVFLEYFRYEMECLGSFRIS